MSVPDRIAATWQLLRSYADWEPPIKIAVAQGAMPGEVPGITEDCPHCQGTGHVPSGRGSCRMCKGTGKHTLDPQTRHEVTDGELPLSRIGELVKRRRVLCDRCGGTGRATGRHGDTEPRCPHCRATGTVEIIDERKTDASLRQIEREQRIRQGLAGADDDPGWWLSYAWDAKAAQWARGSYPELEQLLTLLRAERPMAHSVLNRFVIHPADPLTEVCSERLRDRLDEIILWLADRMPDTIRVPRELRANVREETRDMLWRGRRPEHEQARDERDSSLQARHAAGGSVPELMVEFGLSRPRVYALLSETGQGSVASGPAA